MQTSNCRIIDTSSKKITNKSGISIPISIPKSNSYDKEINAEKFTVEYGLQCGNFNPNKMSPPDPWKSRLEQRLKELLKDPIFPNTK